jgi:hypothetical protein
MAEIQAFENLKNFYWFLNILNGKNHVHVDHVQHVGLVQHVLHVQHVVHVQHIEQVQHVKISNVRLHVGVSNDDRTDYNDQSGAIKPFRVISNLFKQGLFIQYLSYLVCPVCLVHLVNLVCLVCLVYSRMITIINKTIVQLVNLILRKVYHLACCLAAPPYQFGVRAIKFEVRVPIACAEYLREGLEVVLGRLSGWVGGMVKTIFFQLGKCSKIFVNTSVFSVSTGMSTASFVSKPAIILQLNLACQTISDQLTNFYISTSIMLSLTIYLALLCQNVESNPGPHTSKAPTLSVLTVMVLVIQKVE